MWLPGVNLWFSISQMSLPVYLLTIFRSFLFNRHKVPPNILLKWTPHLTVGLLSFKKFKSLIRWLGEHHNRKVIKNTVPWIWFANSPRIHVFGLDGNLGTREEHVAFPPFCFYAQSSLSVCVCLYRYQQRLAAADQAKEKLTFKETPHF